MTTWQKRFLTLCWLALSWPCASAPLTVADEGDPARWTQEDTTVAQQYATARKELAAAYQISLVECARLESVEKQPCLEQAKREYEQELSLLGFRLGPAR